MTIYLVVIGEYDLGVKSAFELEADALAHAAAKNGISIEDQQWINEHDRTWAEIGERFPAIHLEDLYHVFETDYYPAGVPITDT